MPVTKRISKIFRSNDAGNGQTRKDQQGPSLGGQAILEAEEQDQIIAVTQESLQDELKRLQSLVENQNNRFWRQEEASSRTAQEVAHLSRENAWLQTRADQAERRLSELHNARSTDLSSLTTRFGDVSAQLSTAQQERVQLREEKFHLEDENAKLQNDLRKLYALNQEYEAWAPQAKAIQTEYEAKIRNLERLLALALQPMDEASRHTFDAAVQWSRERDEMVERFEVEREGMNLEIRHLEIVSRDKDEQYTQERRTCESRTTELEVALSELRDAKCFIQALEVYQETLQEEVHETQLKLEEAHSELEGTRSELEGARSELEQVGSERERVQSELETAQSTFGEAHSEFAEMHAQVSTQLTKLRALFGLYPTPRQLISVTLFARRFPRIQCQAGWSPFTLCHQVEDLTANELDSPLGEIGLATFIDSISPGSPGHDVIQRLEFRRCPGCNTNKIDGCPDEMDNSLVEYPQWFRQNECRRCTCCTVCLKEKIKKAISENWWYEIDALHWLKCPVDGCQAPLEIGSVGALTNVLRDFTGEDVVKFQGMYRHALGLREALSRVNPRPSPDAISMSISLHQQLVAFGLLKDEFNVGTTNYDNATEPYDAGEVLMGRVERGDLQIPIFTKFFRRSEVAVDCPICVESFYEIEIESQERWTQACEGYEGAWMSEVFSFPTREALPCDHDMDVCKDCIRRHLEAQLEQHGRNSNGRMTCLTCSRILSQQEIKCLASAESAEKYDRYLLISNLSQEPSFRRCLSGTCENGEIHDQDEYPNPHISCGECGFEMCFTHQIPWHTGLSCDQYDSQREHGDPDYRQTQDWMQSNSKNCPGCRVNIEKGNACFHMTCTQCRHEFCWECLGDWTQINPRPGDYVKEAHNAGCWFRDSDIEPTQISGADLQEALRRRERS